MVIIGHTEKKFNLKGGVLIIGSLLWQDHLNKLGDDIRKTWRAEHLLMDNKIMVSVPIRYGRFSDKNKIYTMVFSKKLTKKESGTGWFVPFSKPCITTETELLMRRQRYQMLKEWRKISLQINFGEHLAFCLTTTKLTSYLGKS